MVDITSIQKAVKTALEKSSGTKVQGGVDLTVNLRNIDMSQPKNRIDETVLLPHGFDNVKIAVLGKGISLRRRKRQTSTSSWVARISNGSVANHGRLGRSRMSIGSSWLRRQ